MAPRKSASDKNEFGGSWSIAKLNCVEEYLKAYLKVMKNQRWANLWYIDAFSGDGTQKLKSKNTVQNSLLPEYDSEASNFIKGSSIRAIKASSESKQEGYRGFDNFAFLELSEDKLNNLEQRISEQYPKELKKCDFIAGDVNKKLPKLLSRINWNSGMRGVVFIDPWATQLKWDTLNAFKNTSCDVWILFPIGAVLRIMKKDSMPNNSLANTLDQIFGDRSWESIYKKPSTSQMSLFEEVQENKYRDSGTNELIEYLEKHYSEVFPCKCGSAILRNQTNSPLFALFAFITNRSKKAQEASSRIAKNLLEKIN